jgi:hypothetical protein
MEKDELTVPFRPWLLDLQIAGLTLVIASLAAVLAWQFPASALHTLALTTTGTFAIAAVLFMRRLMRRVHGQMSEARALRKIEKLMVNGWSLKRNVMLTSGDLDGLVNGPDGQALALEIKSKASLRILKGSLWRKDKLVDVKGQPIDSKMLKQARENAFQVNAHPILWFPDAKEQAFANDIEQVTVVCGPPRYLLKTMGIPMKAWWSK